jgi:hypothetical protein
MQQAENVVTVVPPVIGEHSKKTIDNWNQRIKHRVFLAGQGQGKTTFLMSIFDCLCRKIPPITYMSQPHHVINTQYINDSLYTDIYDDVAIDHFDVSDCIPHDRQYDLVIVLVRELTNELQALIAAHSAKCKTIVIFNVPSLMFSFSSTIAPAMYIQINGETIPHGNMRISLELIHKLISSATQVQSAC